MKHLVAPPEKPTPSSLQLSATGGQLEVLGNGARFNVVFSSRRWGKTTLGKLWCIERLGRPQPGALMWWVAPTYRQTQRPFLDLLNAFWPTGLISSFSRQAMRIDFRTGWRFECRSADQPDNLRGEGVHALVCDEHGLVPDAAWEECLRPTLADTNGDFLGIGTPKGRRGWAYRMYQLGLDPAWQAKGFRGYKYTADEAVFIPREELDLARQTMSARAYSQEFMSVFLDTTGAVFENVRSRRVEAQAHEAVALGADWAKKVDFTWFVAVGVESGHVYGCQRLPQRLPYPKQVELFHAFYRRWDQSHGVHFVCHDKTGVGEAVDDLLAQLDVTDKIEGVTFTPKSKAELVDEAIVAFEAGTLGWDTPQVLDGTDYGRMVQEHEDFTLTLNKTGKITYGAPEGMHDDAVCATILANRARRLASSPLARPFVSSFGGGGESEMVEVASMDENERKRVPPGYLR